MSGLSYHKWNFTVCLAILSTFSYIEFVLLYWLVQIIPMFRSYSKGQVWSAVQFSVMRMQAFL